MNGYLTFLLAGAIVAPALAMESKKTELHTAAANCNQSSKVRQIVNQQPAEIARQDGEGNTPLHEAAYFGCTENADLLLRAGADVNKRNYKGETPLDKAHYSHHQSVERLIKEYGGVYALYKDLNKPFNQQQLDTVLWEASGSFNYYKMLSALERGANPKTLHGDWTGVKMTALHRIARSADYTTPHKTMELLLNFGADINQLDSAGWTPYGRASQGADSQTGDYIMKFYEKHNAQFKRGT